MELANLVCDILFVGLVSGEKMAFGMVSDVYVVFCVGGREERVDARPRDASNLWIKSVEHICGH